MMAMAKSAPVTQLAKCVEFVSSRNINIKEIATLINFLMILKRMPIEKLAQIKILNLEKQSIIPFQSHLSLV